MLVFTVFCPGLGLEAWHWLGKASGAVLLGGEGGVLQQAGVWGPAQLAQTHREVDAGWGPEEAGPCTVVIAGTSVELIRL